MYQDKIIRKIPGNITPLSKREHQGYIDDLSKKQKVELEELLQRQNKLLVNKTFISKLPDKGAKIIQFRDKILNELEHKNEVDKAANLLSRLNIASEGKAAMNELEWTGRYTETSAGTKIVELDSDDEEDVLKILAQPTGSGVHEKKIIHLPPEESLIKPEDLIEIESFNAEDLSELEHVKYIINKVENSAEENDTNRRERYKPYRTTRSNVHDPMKEKDRKKDKHWEVTAATPPSSVHGTVKSLCLHESLQLQKDQTDKLQQIQAKHAVERLVDQLSLNSIGSLPINAGSYRSLINKDTSSSNSENEEEHEVHDEEDNDNAGTVVYTIDRIET